MLLGTSGHLVQPCETDPMGQGSLLAVFAYGGLTFRLRFASLTVCLRPRGIRI